MTTPRAAHRSDGLTEQQARFVEEYLANGRNAAAAYRAIYANTMPSRRSAERARELLRRPNVAAMVAEADRKATAATEKAVDKYAITQERIAEEMARLALLDPGDVASQPMSGPEDIAKLPEEIRRAVVGWSWDRHGNLVLKFADKRASLMDLARLKGWLIDRQEHTGKDGGPIETREVSTLEAARRIAHILSAGMMAQQQTTTEG